MCVWEVLRSEVQAFTLLRIQIVLLHPCPPLLLLPSLPLSFPPPLLSPPPVFPSGVNASLGGVLSTRASSRLPSLSPDNRRSFLS